MHQNRAMGVAWLVQGDSEGWCAPSQPRFHAQHHPTAASYTHANQRMSSVTPPSNPTPPTHPSI